MLPKCASFPFLLLPPNENENFSFFLLLFYFRFCNANVKVHTKHKKGFLIFFFNRKRCFMVDRFLLWKLKAIINEIESHFFHILLNKKNQNSIRYITSHFFS